jgi:hypothetical protein
MATERGIPSQMKKDVSDKKMNFTVTKSKYKPLNEVDGSSIIPERN